MSTTELIKTLNCAVSALQHGRRSTAQKKVALVNAQLNPNTTEIVFETTTELVQFINNPNGLVTNWNRGAAQHILGYTEGEIVGVTVSSSDISPIAGILSKQLLHSNQNLLNLLLGVFSSPKSRCVSSSPLQ
jgi:hypothetical protein